MKVANFFKALNMSSSGLSHQRKKLDAIASNIANANTTKTDSGGPYQRKIVTSKLKNHLSFRTILNKRSLKMANTNANHINPGLSRKITQNKTYSLNSQITNDQTPYKKIYNPSHPDADGEGYVLMPNVNPLIEMVDLITASRSYEANLTVIDGFKRMSKEALDI